MFKVQATDFKNSEAAMLDKCWIFVAALGVIKLITKTVLHLVKLCSSA
jgi:hypothetical protein